jgi:hypothetical protein
MAMSPAEERELPSNLSKIARLVTGLGQQASVCEECGNEFTCGARLSGCWCAGVELSDQTRQRLRESYHACLCRNCLEKHAREDGKDSVTSKTV